jgi:hypothetical protein
MSIALPSFLLLFAGLQPWGKVRLLINIKITMLRRLSDMHNIVVIINLAMLPKSIEYGIDRYRESRRIEYRPYAGISLCGHDHTL